MEMVSKLFEGTAMENRKNAAERLIGAFYSCQYLIPFWLDRLMNFWACVWYVI